jgi:hypothetical protein
MGLLEPMVASREIREVILCLGSIFALHVPTRREGATWLVGPFSGGTAPATGRRHLWSRTLARLPAPEGRRVGTPGPDLTVTFLYLSLPRSTAETNFDYILPAHPDYDYDNLCNKPTATSSLSTPYPQNIDAPPRRLRSRLRFALMTEAHTAWTAQWGTLAPTPRQQ